MCRGRDYVAQQETCDPDTPIASTFVPPIPAVPSWSLAVRVSALRFEAPLGTISAIEPGLGSDLDGGLWLELSILQIAARL